MIKFFRKTIKSYGCSFTSCFFSWQLSDGPLFYNFSIYGTSLANWDNVHVYISPIPYIESFSSHQRSREHKLLVLLLLTGIGFLSLTFHPNFPLIIYASTRGEIVSEHHVALTNLQMKYRFFEVAIYLFKFSNKNSFSLWAGLLKCILKEGTYLFLKPLCPKHQHICHLRLDSRVSNNRNITKILCELSSQESWECQKSV